MTEKVHGTKRPMNTEAFKRVCLALVVLLFASAAMVGVGSADDATATAKGEIGVSPAMILVSSQAELESNISAANGQTTIKLADDTAFTDLGMAMSNKDITLIGGENTTIDLTSIAFGYYKDNGGNLTIDNVTIKWPATQYYNNQYQGIKNPNKLVYKNCTLIGLQNLYGDTDFINCTVNNKNDYSVWTYGNNVTFTDCTFNTGGKAVLVYHEYEMHATVTLNNCKFDSDSTLATDKAAVEVGASAYSDDTTYKIIINSCSITNGFVPNKSPSPLWGNKNSMDSEHLTVIIDGVKQTLVYPITWMNEDGTTVIASDLIEENSTPTCSEGNPTKEADTTYTYQFAGWTPELATVTGPATYTAKFTAIKIEVKPDVTVSTTQQENGQTEVTVDVDEIELPEDTPEENEVTVTTATIKTDSGVNVTLVYSENDKATVNKSEGTITGNTTGIVAEYPAASVQSNDAEVPVTYELEINLNPETVETGIPLPTITTTIDTNVANAISIQKGGSGESFAPLAMIQATYDSAKGGIDAVNNNLTGEITLTFVVPASAGTDFVAFHIKDGQTNLLDANSMKIKVNEPAGYTTIILTVDHFSGYAIAKGTYPVVEKPSSSSSSSGSSVWLQEPVTSTEQPTQTPTETEKPTDTVPTDIPSTQPTETPASPAFGALAALAGLGAVAVLRRR